MKKNRKKVITFPEVRLSCEEWWRGRTGRNVLVVVKGWGQGQVVR